MCVCVCIDMYVAVSMQAYKWCIYIRFCVYISTCLLINHFTCLICHCLCHSSQHPSAYSKRYWRQSGGGAAVVMRMKIQRGCWSKKAGSYYYLYTPLSASQPRECLCECCSHQMTLGRNVVEGTG